MELRPRWLGHKSKAEDLSGDVLRVPTSGIISLSSTETRNRQPTFESQGVQGCMSQLMEEASLFCEAFSVGGVFIPPVMLRQPP